MTRNSFLMSIVGAAGASALAAKQAISEPPMATSLYKNDGTSDPYDIECDGEKVKLAHCRAAISEVKPVLSTSGALWVSRESSGMIVTTRDGITYWLNFESNKWERVSA